MNKQIYILFYTLFFTFSCTTSKLENKNLCTDANLDSRSPSSISCEDLLNYDRFHNDHNYNTLSDIVPNTFSDVFWDVVIQLTENDNTLIELKSDEISLTKNIQNKLRIYTTYKFNTQLNSFLLSKIEYAENYEHKELISDNPLVKNSLKLKDDLFKLILKNDPSIKSTDLVVYEKIDYDVYKKIKKSIPTLELFTTYELSKIAKLPLHQRAFKYQLISKSRSIKKYLINNLLNDLILNPLKTVVFTVLSATAVLNPNILTNLITTQQETPAWVAPSIVYMAGKYPKSMDPELTELMKKISNQKSDELKFNEKKLSLDGKEKLIKINETDEFTVKEDTINHKTYFTITHEGDDAQIDVYFTEITPSKFPVLVQYFKQHK